MSVEAMIGLLDAGQHLNVAQRIMLLVGGF